MGIELRAAPRFFLLPPLPAVLNGKNADVIDLSVQGARLQLTEPVAAERTFTFSMDAAGSLLTTAKVLWCEIAGIGLDDGEADRYYCGVSFENVLPAIRHLIEELRSLKAAIPMEELRTGQRCRLTNPLNAAFDDISNARVLDISTRGARIGVARLLPVGASGTLRIRLAGRADTIDVMAAVVWSRPAERIGRFESGLRIEGGEEVLRTLIDALNVRNQLVVETNSLERKFNPLLSHPLHGVLGLLR